MESKAPGSSLYPTDPAERALVNQRLYFDAGVLYTRVRAIAVSVAFAVHRLAVIDKVLLHVNIESKKATRLVSSNFSLHATNSNSV